MRDFFNLRLLKYCVFILLISVLMTGCGQKNNEQLMAYKESMDAFYNKLAYYDSSINGINAEDENAKNQLLQYMDEMNETYQEMAALEIPEEFSGISEIAVEAADYMQMANDAYHQAYDGEFNEDYEQLAGQYYGRANSRVQVMLQVLHGEVPSGEGITVTTEEAYQFSTISTDTEGE